MVLRIERPERPPALGAARSPGPGVRPSLPDLRKKERWKGTQQRHLRSLCQIGATLACAKLATVARFLGFRSGGNQGMGIGTAHIAEILSVMASEGFQQARLINPPGVTERLSGRTTCESRAKQWSERSGKRFTTGPPCVESRRVAGFQRCRDAGAPSRRTAIVPRRG